MLGNANIAQQRFIQGKALSRYGQKKSTFIQGSLSRFERVLFTQVGKLQRAVLTNIAKKKQISSGNFYQITGGSIQKERTVTNAAMVFFWVPRYANYIDKGVRGAKSSYASARNSPYAYTNKRPPFADIQKHLVLKYAVPQKQLYVATKSLQKRIFEKGIKGTKVLSSAMSDKFVQTTNQALTRAAKEQVIIEILEL